MNCESALLAMNAAIDNELSDADRHILEQHLTDCPTCREEWDDLQRVHISLRQALKPTTADAVVSRVMRMINEPANRQDAFVFAAKSRDLLTVIRTNVRRDSEISTRRPASFLIVIALIFMLTAVSFTFRTPSRAIAEVTYSTGAVEVRPVGSKSWVMHKGSKRISLRANARIRTGENALCEIRTTSDALVRLNQGTELLVQKPDRLELVSGELWCRAPADASLKISPEPIAERPFDFSVFTCPGDSETQWESRPEQELRCLATSPSPVEIRIADSPTSCSMNPGDVQSFESPTKPRFVEHADLLRATAWQLPLLILKNRDDQELQQRLRQLLAEIGQTKMSYLYEEQIRKLGPAGTLPLLAFVQSADSKSQAELRQRAMRIIADLAPASAMSDLKQLLDDSDPMIRQLASNALQRLNNKE